jgi:uncharacterized protein YcbK (DUF882 family)
MTGAPRIRWPGGPPSHDAPSAAPERRLSRRAVLRLWAAGALGLSAVGGRARAAAAPRGLALHSLHTGESLDTVYWADGRYLREALAGIDCVLRDHRTDEIHPIDRRLLDLLATLRDALQTREPFQVISGYRSAATNAWLAATTGGVSRRSLHVEGMAIDIRVPGRSIEALREAALALAGGGVGFYRASGFVHVDVGRVRAW